MIVQTELPVIRIALHSRQDVGTLAKHTLDPEARFFAVHSSSYYFIFSYDHGFVYVLSADGAFLYSIPGIALHASALTTVRDGSNNSSHESIIIDDAE